MLNWNDKLETGHPIIDAQHKMLISYINRLEVFGQTAHPGAEEIALFMRVLEFLEDYSLSHFKQEEDCMFRLRCHAHGDNKRAHSEFIDFFREFKRRLESSGYRSALVKELHVACSIWIQRHILKIDVQIKPCLNPQPAPDDLE